MGKYPVTQAQWRQVASLPKIDRNIDPNPSYFQGDDRPVEQVSWYDAKEFCLRLSQKTGRNYRLPSETEWEYAARANTTTPFHFGQTITTDLANYDGNYTYRKEPTGYYRGQTTPVGYFNIANLFGLYDLHGNVWEWCLDYWHYNYQGAPTDGSPWLASYTDTTRVIRGGSWGIFPSDCRCAYRNHFAIDFPVNHIGFRVVFQ